MADDRTIPHDFEKQLAEALSTTLPDPPPHLDRHIREAVRDVLEHRNDPEIPTNLLEFNPSEWASHLRPDRDAMRRVDAYGAWRHAQYEWSVANGIWSGDFPAIQERQLAKLRAKQTP